MSKEDIKQYIADLSKLINVETSTTTYEIDSVPFAVYMPSLGQYGCNSCESKIIVESSTDGRRYSCTNAACINARGWVVKDAPDSD